MHALTDIQIWVTSGPRLSIEPTVRFGFPNPFAVGTLAAQLGRGDMYFESENRSWFRAAGLFALLALAAVFVLDEPLARVARGGVSGDLRRPLEWSEGYAHGLGVILISLCIARLDERRRQFVPRLLIVVDRKSVV